MSLENTIQDTINDLFGRIKCSVNKIRIEKSGDNIYKVNLEVSDPNLLIGYHGENIRAIQHLVKLLVGEKHEERFDIYLDIDGYRKRQEENMINLAERKVEMARKLSLPQSLPAMTPYYRRLVHMHLAQDKFKDISTESQGEGESRYIVIKPQLTV